MHLIVEVSIFETGQTRYSVAHLGFHMEGGGKFLLAFKGQTMFSYFFLWRFFFQRGMAQWPPK